MSRAEAKYRMPLLVAVALTTVWVILGVFDARYTPYTGYQTDSGYVVISVAEGGPAEAAGLQVGDRVLAVDGIAVENTREIRRQPRAQVGQTTNVEIDRGGSTMTIGIVNAGLPPASMFTSYASALIGICFVFFGFSAYTKAPARKTLLLALAGVGIGFNFAAGPYIASPTVSTVIVALSLPLVYIGLAMLYHFILSMPKPSAGIERPGAVRMLYAPAIITGLALAVIISAQVDATGTLNRLIQIVVGLVIAGYFLGSVVTMIRRFRGATAQERAVHGLGLMLYGTILGFAPIIFAIVMGIIAPRVVLPGANYLILTFVLIPVTFSMAAVRSVRAGEILNA